MAKATSYLKVGSAGGLHFLLRFAQGENRAGFPLLQAGMASGAVTG